MRYAAEETYFDSGATRRRLIAVTDECESRVEYNDGYDYYLDVFATKAEAQQFMRGDYVDES